MVFLRIFCIDTIENRIYDNCAISVFAEHSCYTISMQSPYE